MLVADDCDFWTIVILTKFRIGCLVQLTRFVNQIRNKHEKTKNKCFSIRGREGDIVQIKQVCF